MQSPVRLSESATQCPSISYKSTKIRPSFEGLFLLHYAQFLSLYFSMSIRFSLLDTIRAAATSPVVFDMVSNISMIGAIPIMRPMASIGTPRQSSTTLKHTIADPGTPGAPSERRIYPYMKKGVSLSFTG